MYIHVDFGTCIYMYIGHGLQIVKQEWPRNWTSFITDIVGASKTSESLCTNNMAILKLLRSDPRLLCMCVCTNNA